MQISIIVATAENGVIGLDNKLIWRLSDDLKLFKKRTSGHPIIMGRKTFDSIGKPLPNRTNIVISRSQTLEIEGCIIVNSFEHAIVKAKKSIGNQEIFVIGGEKIYKLAAPFATKLYLTKVDAALKGDAFFDIKVYKNWKEISKVSFQKDEKNEFNFEVFELLKPSSGSH